MLHSSVSDDALFFCGDFRLRTTLPLRSREGLQLLGGLFSKSCQFEPDLFLQAGALFIGFERSRHQILQLFWIGLTFVKHLEGTKGANEAITQLIAVLDTRELADAMNRVERGYGLRVVK